MADRLIWRKDEFKKWGTHLSRPVSDSIKRAQEIWSRPSGAARSHIKPYGKNKDLSHRWEAHNSPVPPEPVRNLTSATIRRWFWTQGTHSWPKCNFSSRTTKKRKPLWIKLDAQKEERQKLPSPNAKSQEIGNLNQWQYCSLKSLAKSTFGN